jgi:hypothetical protein
MKNFVHQMDSSGQDSSSQDAGQFVQLTLILTANVHFQTVRPGHSVGDVILKESRFIAFHVVLSRCRC